MSFRFDKGLQMRTVLTCGFLSACIGSANADPVLFNGPGWTTWTVPTTGLYAITAYGADGGGVDHPLGTSATGGDGAIVQAGFYLNSGTIITIAVGSKGGDGPSSVFEEASAGGGGASVVYGNNGNLLLVAGGGGGAGSSSGQNGLNADTSSIVLNGGSTMTPSLSGVNAYSSNSGTNGSGGRTGGVMGGPGGGGIFFDGGSSLGYALGGDALKDFANDNFSGVSGSANGGAGGYNGGGPGVGDVDNDDGFGGGGGGGYSGGGGGGSNAGIGYGGGSGGSYSADPGADFFLNTITQNGMVTITEQNGLGAPAPSPVPEPSSFVFTASGLFGLIAIGANNLKRMKSRTIR